jgi:hypothetical protein
MAWILEQPLVTSIFHFLMTVFLVLVTQPCIVGHAQTQDELVAGFIKTEVEQFRASGNLIHWQRPNLVYQGLALLYTRLDFRPSWTDGEKTEQLIIAVRDTYSEGLPPVITTWRK